MKKNQSYQRIKQPKRSYTCLTGVVPVWNHFTDQSPRSELIRFESQLERNFILKTEFCIDCCSIRRAKKILWHDGMKNRQYTPDFDVQTWDENKNPLKRYVVEVKRVDELEKKAAELEPKFAAMREIYEKEGIEFIIQTDEDINDDFLKNAIFLREFRRHPYLEYPLSEVYGIEKQILDLLLDLGQATPNSLLACISDDKWKRAAYLPYVWRLVCEDQICANLLEPLTMESPLWHIDHHKEEGILWRRFLK
ncbi:TnsA endonuclease N-terminal domain-containing protein [Coraliomargarita sp. SDUM461003]|uniref:TnsA endonuclease N-terminal domain-containing protein n=1 Tax=Thalassobacterium maritimum TaxID=3041265 RepID=A0ABU1AP14_9BACT|nr:TnsA endonuclease N-terminal domain-containing protein [Coraliomargarita sp. SDUM461003]MDQ8205906.1 TnsA endonuclease N-terminal domain-containing protein [Coraliomargarita sp. SDUM461003]